MSTELENATMPKPWKVLSSEVVLRTYGVTVHKDHVDLCNGKTIEEYHLFEFKEWVTVLPLTENREVVLVKQYRHGLGEIILEFPAGAIDHENEAPLEAAQRELVEETGYDTNDWLYLGSFSLGPSRIRNRFYLFLARNCQKVGEQNLDELEDIEVVKISYEQFEQLLNDGQIHDVDTALAWLLCKNKGC